MTYLTCFPPLFPLLFQFTPLKENNMDPDISQIQKTQKGLSRIDLHLLRLSRVKKKNTKQTERGQHLLLQFHLLRFLSGSLTFPPWPLFVFFCLFAYRCSCVVIVSLSFTPPVCLTVLFYISLCLSYLSVRGCLFFPSLRSVSHWVRLHAQEHLLLVIHHLFR